MDIQLKKGILEICVLATLIKEESYGYKIVDDLKPIIEISESTLYPILRRLEQGGLLSTESREHNGRLRKYYHITRDGKIKINDFKAEMQQFEKIYKFIDGANAI